MSDDLLRVDLVAGYGSQTVLHGVRFALKRGERLGLAGTSGTGKSTLILALMGLLGWRRGWVKGEVCFEGQNLLELKEREMRRVRGKRIALVPQNPTGALNGALTLRAHFEEAWKAHVGRTGPQFVMRMGNLMERVRLPGNAGFLGRRAGEISVGQAQRLTIALALLHRPALVIADEPTSALDPANQVEVLGLLREANAEDGTALVYVSHDLMSVLRLCERLAVLDEGRVVESLAVNDIEERAQHAATIALLKTLPVPARLIYQYAQGASGPREVGELHPARGTTKAKGIVDAAMTGSRGSETEGVVHLNSRSSEGEPGDTTMNLI